MGPGSVLRRIVLTVGWLALFPGGSQAEERWSYFAVAGADFVVAMPGTPKSVTDTTDANGAVSKVYLSESSDAAYLVDYSFFPRGVIPDTVSADQFIARGMSAGLAKDLKVLSDRRFKFGDASAAEFVGEKAAAQPGVVKVRVYARRDAAGNMRAYQSTVGGPPGSENNADSLRFLNSFKFVPK